MAKPLLRKNKTRRANTRFAPRSSARPPDAPPDSSQTTHTPSQWDTPESPETKASTGRAPVRSQSRAKPPAPNRSPRPKSRPHPALSSGTHKARYPPRRARHPLPRARATGLPMPTCPTCPASAQPYVWPSDAARRRGQTVRGHTPAQSPKSDPKHPKPPRYPS